MSSYSPTDKWKRGLLRAERVRVSMPAPVVTMSAYQFPELADISASGAKLRGAPLPPAGATVLLRAGPLEVLGRIVWVKAEECGVRFEEAVPPATLKQIQLQARSRSKPSLRTCCNAAGREVYRAVLGRWVRKPRIHARAHSFIPSGASPLLRMCVRRSTICSAVRGGERSHASIGSGAAASSFRNINSHLIRLPLTVSVYAPVTNKSLMSISRPALGPGRKELFCGCCGVRAGLGSRKPTRSRLERLRLGYAFLFP